MSSLQSCVETWIKTLEHYGIHRNINIREETEIGRAVQKWGADYVQLALFGARFEPRTENYDPRDFVSLRRIFGKDPSGHERIDRFVNLGSRKGREATPEKIQPVEISLAETATFVTDPEKIRSLIGKSYRKIRV